MASSVREKIDENKKKIGLSIIVVLALLAAFILLSGEKYVDEDREPINWSSDHNKVIYTGSNFNPRTIRIEKGEAVKWVDRSTGSEPGMWIASSDHQTHSNYDGNSLEEHCEGDSNPFDQCKQGKNYSFRFDKAGTWEYHNHDPYVVGGRVIVEE